MLNQSIFERRNKLRNLIQQNPRERPDDAINRFRRFHLYGDKLSTKQELLLLRTDLNYIKRNPKALVVYEQCRKIIAQILAIQRVIH